MAQKPESLRGQWLRALVQRDVDTSDWLAAQERAKEDAVAVVESAFELAVHRLFKPGCPVRDITVFVFTLSRRHGGSAEKVPIRETEALIREVLGEPMPTRDIDPAAAISIKIKAFVAFVDELGLYDHEIGALIAEAEELAVSRGFSPDRADFPE